MNSKDVSLKLAATEANLKRWQTRLKRAATKVSELDKARRRYQLMLLNPDQPVIATVKVRQQKLTLPQPQESSIDVVEVNRQLGAAIASTFTAPKIAEIAAKVHDDLDIPAALDRRDPLIAEKMTAARKKAEADERKKIPLTGKAARDYIKRKK